MTVVGTKGAASSAWLQAMISSLAIRPAAQWPCKERGDWTMKSRNNARQAKRAQRVLHDMFERDALGIGVGSRVHCSPHKCSTPRFRFSWRTLNRTISKPPVRAISTHVEACGLSAGRRLH